MSCASLEPQPKKRRWIRFCWKLPVEVFYCYTLADFLHRSPIKIRYRYLNECLINPGFINPYGLCIRNSHCNNSGGIIVLMSMGCGAFVATLLANMSHPCIWSNYDPSVIAVSCAAFDALSERSKNWTKNTPFWQIWGFLQAFKDQIYTPARSEAQTNTPAA